MVPGAYITGLICSGIIIYNVSVISLRLTFCASILEVGLYVESMNHMINRQSIKAIIYTHFSI